MDKMLLLLTVIIVVYPILHASLVRADGYLSKPLVSKQAATDGCLKQGTTLISNKDIKDYGSGTEYLNQLNDGESAWIEGYATLSPFLVLMGCFNTTDWRVPSTVRKEVAMDNPNVYECVTECRGLRFVGIENTSCYCIPEHDINGRDFLQRGVNNSACSISCNDEMNSCGGYLYMNLYQIANATLRNSFNWGANEPSSHLCLYAERNRNDSSDVSVLTASCHRPAPVLIHGYICIGLRGTGLSTDNCSRSRSEREFDFCIMEDTVITRTEAFEGCLNRNGILGLPYGQILNHNTTYWSGRQRTFKVSETYNEGESLCLSVVRVGSRLYTEPDSCTAQKTFLCKGSLESDTMTTSMSRTELTNQTYTARRTEILQSSSESSSSGMSVPAFILSVVSFVAAVICVTMVTIVLRRTKKMQNDARYIMCISPSEGRSEGSPTAETTPYYMTVT